MKSGRWVQGYFLKNQTPTIFFSILFFGEYVVQGYSWTVNIFCVIKLKTQTTFYNYKVQRPTRENMGAY